MSLAAVVAGLAGLVAVFGKSRRRLVRRRLLAVLLGATTRRAGSEPWRLLVRRRGQPSSRPPDVAALAGLVAALSRAGLPPVRIWQVLAGRPGSPNEVCAAVAVHLAAGGRTGEALLLVPGPPAMRWLAVACDVADRAGAPLAEVLDRFADALRADEAAVAEREAALAGPRATATVLSVLPAGGLALGLLLGADPLATLVGTAAGRLCLVGGAACWAGGRLVVARLVAAAERAGG